MTLPRKLIVLTALAAAVLGPATRSANATFHEISIREVYPGSAAQPEAEYVELQMWSGGQNLVAGHSLFTYGAGGGMPGAATFASDVPGGANQSTILLATPAAEAAFGVTADASLAGDRLGPLGGAVCWESLDCVSWGSFGASLPSPAGSPATPAGIPDGMALRRTIAPRCPTLLEATDDSDNSAADLAVVFPSPRPNSLQPSERDCASPGGQQGGPGGGKGGRGAPQTTLRSRPPRRSGDRTPTFRFASDEPRSTFRCKLDGKPFRSCRSPFTAKRLALGPHAFRVRAVDESGKPDPSPAFWAFRVLAK